MTPEQLQELIAKVCKSRTETQNLELKSAQRGCPRKLYSTLSSFSNQDCGGIILFGIDEEQDFKAVGVYDAHDLQRGVVEQCSQMSPAVRPLFTVCELDGRWFVSAEVPAIDKTERPCFYMGQGRTAASYIRVGAEDLHMTEYEVYSYDALKNRYKNDIRPVEQAKISDLDSSALASYIQIVQRDRPNMARLDAKHVYELMGISRDGVPSLAAVLLFGLYPQAFLPQLCITCTAVPGTAVGDKSREQQRFLDNRRIEGTIPEMLEQALAFACKNMKLATVVETTTGRRSDRYEYPVSVVREALLNALLHRDYSVYTEGMPITLVMFHDGMEIRSPGGVFGKISVDRLGEAQPDTRNPNLAVAMEKLGLTENRYSGIPSMRMEMKEYGLDEPELHDSGSNFLVRLRNGSLTAAALSGRTQEILNYCAQWRSRREIAAFLGISSVSYAIRKHVSPLVEQGLLTLARPEAKQSPRQRYRRADTEQHA